ncbi:DUF4054 domain-containing protein [Stenotrophomonas phage B2]|nr:DUF4054 domain-containing protein [Stenotrophomonas phage B2]
MKFPLAKFRLVYPTFASVPDDVVLALADEALCLASVRGCKCSESAWMALTAHLLALRAAGDQPTAGVLASATIDKVSVSLRAPTSKTDWSHWLSLTPYGTKALALLAACAAGGRRVVGGLPERDGFRSVYGIRGGGYRGFRR